MKYLAYLISIFALAAGMAPAALAVVPPSTAFSEQFGNMTPGDWLFYGSIVIALSALFVMAAALLTRFATRLFRH